MQGEVQSCALEPSAGVTATLMQCTTPERRGAFHQDHMETGVGRAATLRM